jgi:plastocyanin
MRHPWWRLIGALAVASAGTIAIPAPAHASGGGGCGEPISDSPGTEVTIQNFCFSPTVLRVDPGQVVTFTNLDPYPHTVMGANAVWGSYEMLKRNREASYSLLRPGVYPYVCTYHPGMVGVVVVGSGNGPGAAGLTITSDGPVQRVLPNATGPTAPSPETLPTTNASSRLPTGARPSPAIALASLGLLAVVGAVLVRERRRRRA